MSEKMKYKTKQREEVLTYLKTVPGQHVTVADIVRYMRDKGSSVGTTTVYRQIERLVDDVVDARPPGGDVVAHAPGAADLADPGAWIVPAADVDPHARLH